MILNNKQNLFVVQFQDSFFYPTIRQRWEPVVKRLKLPYEKVADFLNSCIQSVSWPSLDVPNVQQQQSEFPIVYKGGKELEPIYDKNLSITFKLSEGYFSYFICLEQIEEFLRYKEGNVYWPSMFVSFLDLNGLEIVVFEFEKIIPQSLSQFELSYSSTAAEFSTFTMSLKYNRFNIIRRLDNNNYTLGKNKYPGAIL